MEKNNKSESVNFRQRAEDLLIASETRYRRLFESAKEGILILDAETGMITDVNPFLIEMLGYSEDQFRDKAIWEIGFFKDIIANLDKFSELQQKEYVRYDDLPLETADGRKISVEFVSNSYFEDNKKVIQCNIRETTERKKSEDALLESEIKYRAFFENSMDAILLTNPNGKILSANQASCDMFGYSEDELIRLGKSAIVDMSDSRLSVLLDERKLKGKARGEVTFLRKDGTRFPAEISSAVFKNHEGSERNSMIIRDITERKRTEEALRESEQLYRSLFENMLNGFAYCKMIFEDERPQDFIYLAVNNSFETLTGLKDVIGKKVSDVIPGIRKSDPILFEVYGRVALTGKPETIEIYVEALKMWFSISIYSHVNEYFVSVFDVITKRKKAEEVLRQSEAKFRKLINSLPDPMLVVDSQGRIVYCNENAVKTFDYNIDEMLNCTMEDLIPKHFRKLHITLRNEYFSEPKSRAMGDGKELFAQRKGGSEFPTEVMLEPVEINGNQFTLAIVRDITARKSAEIELIEAKEKAEESDRLKSAFLANMSHEVRTPLNSIIGFSELLGDPDFEEDQKNEFIQHIVASGNNLLNIISDIMDISKMESGEITIRKKPINAPKFVSGVYEQFSFQAGIHKLELILNLPDNDKETEVFADAERLMQIFNNLIGNAFKFTVNGSIKIGYRHKGEMVEFFVKDTGIGIPASYHDKIFDRFRQVEDEKTRKYGGNGLGLAITKNLVNLMGGKIWVDSNEGKGSAFYFTMPMN